MKHAAAFALVALLALAGVAQGARELRFQRTLKCTTGACGDDSTKLVGSIMKNCNDAKSTCGLLYALIKKGATPKYCAGLITGTLQALPAKPIDVAKAKIQIRRKPTAEAYGESIAETVVGTANSDAGASVQNFGGDAKALVKSCALTVIGDAFSNGVADSTAVLGDAKAAVESIANACVGLAISTSAANVYAILGDGKAVSTSNAKTVIGDALADSTANCVSVGGKCEAIGQSVAETVVGDATANTDVSATCLSGESCSGTGSSRSSTTNGNASSTTRVVVNGGK